MKILILSVLVSLYILVNKEANSLPIKGDNPANIRDLLITKESLERRKNKQLFKLPPPFTITSTLHINNKEEEENQNGRNSRRGRTWVDKSDGNIVVEGIRMPDDETDRVTWRNGRVINNIFVPDNINEDDLPEFTIQSSTIKRRKPRKGRTNFPNPPFIFDQLHENGINEPDNLAVESRQSLTYELPLEQEVSSRDYNYRAGNTDNGRPVYYVVEEPDSLHSDRSPYDFEPATNNEFGGSAASSGNSLSHFTQGGVSAASNNDFVIKEHTYTMCPGCPSFSIPVPIPKTSFYSSEAQLPSPSSNYNQIATNNIAGGNSRNLTFLEKIGDQFISTMTDIQNKILGKKGGEPKRTVFLQPSFANTNENAVEESKKELEKGDEQLTPGLTERISEKLSDVTGVDEELVPVIAAGAAVAALGGFAFLATSLQNVSFAVTSGKRSFNDDGGVLNKFVMEDVVEKFEEAYDETPECMPKEKCLILLKHEAISPEIIYAKEFYRRKFSSRKGEEIEVCELLKCLTPETNEKTSTTTKPSSTTTTKTIVSTSPSPSK